MWSSVYNLCLYKAQFPEKRHCPSHLLHAVTSVFNLSDCPSHDSLGRTQQKLHPKLVNDCLLVRLHHRLSNLSTGEANLQPSLFTGVMRGHSGRTYNGIKFTNMSCCIMAKFYAKRSLLYNGKILCQRCLAVTQGKLLC